MGKNELPRVLPYNKKMYRALPVVALVLGTRLQLDRESLFAEILPPPNKGSCQLSPAPALSGHSQPKANRALLLNSGRTSNFYMLPGKNIFKQAAAWQAVEQEEASQR